MNSFANFLLILASISLSANTCTRDSIQIEKIMNIYWQHSFEDDQGDTVAYRPKDYNFPRSRGRAGFEFKENGVFYKYVIAPADGIDTLRGTWTKGEEVNIFLIQFSENKKNGYPTPADYKLKILDFNETERILKVKRD